MCFKKILLMMLCIMLVGCATNNNPFYNGKGHYSVLYSYDYEGDCAKQTPAYCCLMRELDERDKDFIKAFEKLDFEKIDEIKDLDEKIVFSIHDDDNDSVLNVYANGIAKYLSPNDNQLAFYKTKDNVEKTYQKLIIE